MFWYINIELDNQQTIGKGLTLSYTKNDKNVALPSEGLKLKNYSKQKDMDLRLSYY